MAETSGPFDSGSLTEADWELMFQLLVDGVIDTPTGTKLKASASGAITRGVDFTAGTALVGGHWYRNDSVLTVTSAANGASSARIDRGVLRLDRTGNTVTIAVLTGTAGSPSPPALTDNTSVTEKPLYRWTVAPGAAGVTSIVDERQFAGALPRPCTSTNRPINPRRSEIGYETDTGRWIGWDGAQWDILIDDTGDVALPVYAPSVWQSYWPHQWARKRNGLVTVEINLKRIDHTLNTDSSDGSTGSQLVTLPSGMRPSRSYLFVPVVLTGGIFGRLRVQSDGVVYLQATNVDVTVGRFVRCCFTFQVP